MPIEILMPALSPTMTEGNLVKWLKKEGDAIEPGQVIAEIETDKATMEVESVDEGVMGKIVVSEGTQSVKVNALIGVLQQEGDSDKDIAAMVKEYEEKAAQEVSVVEEVKVTQPQAQQAVAVGAMPTAVPVTASIAAPVVVPMVTTTSHMEANANIKASPIAKRLAEEKHIDLSAVPGSGPHGRVVKKDIEDFIKSGGAGTVVKRNAQEAIALPNDNIRKVIASRLTQAKQTIPHFYVTIDCKLDALLSCRQDINAEAPVDAEGKPLYKVSVNDLVVKAIALALRKVPAANASWTDEAIIQYNNIDISIAVATEGGLITPIVRNADQKPPLALSTEIKELAKRARANQLKPEEFQGGGFTVSNLGMYGVKQFNAIINPPQGCILAVGAGEQRPVVTDGELEVATIMECTLSCDHRVVDGAVGAEFLAAFKHYIEHPVAMLI